MKNIKRVEKTECFKELSKKEKQKISGGGKCIATVILKGLIPYIMP